MAAITHAVTRVISRYATFTGRATRSEYWWWVLAMIVLQLITQAIDAALFGRGPEAGQPISFLVSLGILLPSIAVGARRLHDIGKSAWWLLIAFIPILGALVLIYFYIQPSDAEANDFGAPDPLPED